MVATVADVLTLEEAKRQLGVPADVGDFDARIQDAINQAVSWVGKVAGVPLVDEETGFGFEASGSEPGRIMLPVGWPAPTQIINLTYYVTGGSLRSPAVPAQSGATAYRETPSGDWLLRPADFGLTDWPTNYTASLTCKVGMATIPERVVAAVVVAMRVLYRNEPLPFESVTALLDA